MLRVNQIIVIQTIRPMSCSQCPDSIAA